MTAEIRTQTSSNGDIVTPHQPPESVRAWVNRHTTAVKAATPVGDTLTTSWPAKVTPPPDNAATTRAPSQNDAAYVGEHVEDYLTAMVANPPVDQ